jgi:hypothetical protein
VKKGKCQREEDCERNNAKGRWSEKKRSDTGRRCKKKEVPQGEGVEKLCCHRQKEQKRSSDIEEG